MDDSWLVLGVSLTGIPFLIIYVCQALLGQEYPKFVKVVEVGPRDGLQNEKVSPFISHECNLCAS